MTPCSATVEQLQAEVDRLRRQLEEAEETLHAIRSGGVDAFLIEEPRGDRVYTLQTADRPYRILVESMQQGALTLTADGVMLFCNGRFAELLRRPPSALIGTPLSTLVQPRERPLVEALLQKAQGETVHEELRLVRGDGALVPAHLTVNPLPLDGPVTLCAVVSDLTVQKQYEELTRSQEALRVSEELFRATFELAGVGKTQVDAVSGRFLRANASFCELTGYTAEELAGKTPGDLTHPADRAADAPRIAALLSGEADAYTAEKRYVRKDGGTIWVQVHATLLRGRDGRPERTIDMVQDITDRVKAVEELRLSEQRFRVMAETVPDILYTTHADGRRDYTNPRFYHYTGLPAGEADGEGWEAALHPGDRPAVRASWRQAIRDGGPFEARMRLRGADGEYRWFQGRARPIHDEGGAVVKWFGVCSDIDDLIRAEEVLREADRRKNEFLAMLAHELRNPLAPIRNAVQVFRMMGPAEPNVRWARDVIDRQVSHLARLVDDLLDVSRITRGKVQLQMGRLNVAAILGRAVETSRPLIDARQHRLEVVPPDAPLLVEGDETRLTQVVANLLNNAAKYTPRGGQIHLEALRQGCEAVIRIRDSGVGIAPEMLPRVFELFTQVERSLDRSEGGLGIGLTLVHALVHLHGGSVEAHSDGPGKGCTFVVRLPCLDEEEAAQPADLPPAATDLSARRILIVDDNRDAADSLALMLRFSGHDVRAVYDGPESLDAAHGWPPEVVLLDIGLPRMDGYEVARRLRRQPGLERVLLVAMTGYGQEEDRRRSLEAGFDVHLVKPVDPKSLGDLLADRGRFAR